MNPAIPDVIEALASARTAARARRDWAEADRLRAEIEGAGWKVIDRGVDYSLEPAHPPDVVEGERVRFGSSASVPSMLDEPARGAATVVVVATDWPADVDRAVAGVVADAPEGTSVVVVANAPADGYAPPDGTEVVWTSARLGHAAAINAGIRRATAPVVVLLDASVEPTGDFITPLVAALADEGVAVAGAFGVASGDLRTFAEAPAGDVDAIEGYCLAFRRGDFVTRGPLDEHFRFYRNLDLWWSFVLRDEGEGSPARRAVAIDLPLVRHEHREWTQTPEEERSRLSKRNLYRIIDRFGRRYDLLSAPRAKGR